MKLVRIELELTTNSVGSATGNFKFPSDASMSWSYLSGMLYGIGYVKDPTTPFDFGVNFNIVVASTSQVIWQQNSVNGTIFKFPRIPASDVLGTDLSPTTYRCIPLAVDTVTATVSGGGNTKKGKFHLIIAHDVSYTGGGFI